MNFILVNAKYTILKYIHKSVYSSYNKSNVCVYPGLCAQVTVIHCQAQEKEGERTCAAMLYLVYILVHHHVLIALQPKFPGRFMMHAFTLVRVNGLRSQ